MDKCLKLIFHPSSLSSSRMTPDALREGLGVTAPGEGVSSWQAMLIEAWITCTLVLTILASTNSRRKLPTFMAPIPIGFAVGLGLLIGVSTRYIEW